MKMRRWFLCAAAGLLPFWYLSGPASAQIRFTEQAYNALAPADTQETIPVGTKITTNNWQKYKRFMMLNTQILFSGSYRFHIGTGPDYVIEVGPTIPIVLPKQVMLDTEKYATQAKLIKLDDGGYTVSGYVAGVPFPNPTEPDKAAKVIFDLWYSFKPYVVDVVYSGESIDSQFSVRASNQESIAWKLDHLSDTGYPRTLPGGDHCLWYQRTMVNEPEQSRYTTSLSLWSDDPSKVQDSYVFLPSLRRSLRLSAAARCAPSLGLDWVLDDGLQGVGFQPSNFRFNLLGEKKVLAMVHADLEARQHLASFHLGGPLPWPKPVVGKWELRDVWVVDVTPGPKISSYCYGHKVIYADKEIFGQVGFEMYDSSEKLWKTTLAFEGLSRLSSGEWFDVIPFGDYEAVDFQNSHGSLLVAGLPLIDKDVPAEFYNNYKLYSSPAGLTRILR